MLFRSIDEEMIEEFYMSTQNDLDIIATHYEVLSYVVTRINTKSQDDDKIILDVSGFVNVRHQYGSDGDMKRGDGFEMEARYPFSSKLIASYKNREGDVHIVNKTIDIDTVVEVTKIINPLLDDSDIFDNSYILDVSSKEKGV